jgi:hypothetical protein
MKEQDQKQKNRDFYVLVIPNLSLGHSIFINRRSMKFSLIAIMFFLLGACTHGQRMQDIEKRIQMTEKKQYEEIRADLQILIDGHPELTSSQRETLSSQVLAGFDRHRLLREQEGQIIALMLHSTLDPTEKGEVKKELKDKLEDLYKMKARNIEEVVDKVAAPLRNIPPKSQFEYDFNTLMREFR